ncbi:Alpha-aminoadipate--LysW ligase LysX [Corynebacterium capitovis DSM 44611]|uniref:ATP-grasp domain-containing protein n=1 Tax=Corynebacterium capitovis TaxID=131081 RepID=UPI00037D3A28|nr:hypothetical protein [Corynebacterium capitovis]WKD57916.1 Alpha-aminoadipate--LysW ligase LysX [Corynebacterium capitovis DSM 44611]
MLEILVLADATDDEDHAVLFPALRERGVSVYRVHPNELTITIDDSGFTFSAGGRTLSPSLVLGWVLDDLLIPGMALLDVFERAGIPVINGALTLFRAQNKLTDSAQLAASGVLNYPVTAGTDQRELERWMRQRAVVKPLSGYGGRGLKLIDAAADLPEGESFYAVPWIDNPGRDIRVYTVNHHPVFAMYRYAPPGKWITNVLAGGGIAMCPLTPEVEDLARRASQAAGTLIGGIDIGENTKTGELVVYETNSCPSLEPAFMEEVADFLVSAARDLPGTLATWKPKTVYRELNDDETLFHESKRGKLVR